MSTRLITVFSTRWANRLCYLLFLAKICYLIQAMCLITVNECAKHFCRFFIKKIKSVARCFFVRIFILSILLVTQLLLRSDAKSYRPIL